MIGGRRDVVMANLAQDTGGGTLFPRLARNAGLTRVSYEGGGDGRGGRWMRDAGLGTLIVLGWSDENVGTPTFHISPHFSSGFLTRRQQCQVSRFFVKKIIKELSQLHFLTSCFPPSDTHLLGDTGSSAPKQPNRHSQVSAS